MIMGTLKLFNIGNMVTYSMNESSMISSKGMEILISDGKIIEMDSAAQAYHDKMKKPKKPKMETYIDLNSVLYGPNTHRSQRSYASEPALVLALQKFWEKNAF